MHLDDVKFVVCHAFVYALAAIEISCWGGMLLEAVAAIFFVGSIALVMA